MHIQPANPRIALVVRARRGAVVAVTALACAALMSACGSSTSSTSSAPSGTNLNIAQIQASIEESIFNKKHLRTKVACPAVVPMEKGNSFVCIATTSKGVKTPFGVTQQNNRGYVTYAAK
jgi:Domain of unknown function (DUF4333)